MLIIVLMTDRAGTTGIGRPGRRCVIGGERWRQAGIDLGVLDEMGEQATITIMQPLNFHDQYSENS